MSFLKKYINGTLFDDLADAFLGQAAGENAKDRPLSMQPEKDPSVRVPLQAGHIISEASPCSAPAKPRYPTNRIIDQNERRAEIVAERRERALEAMHAKNKENFEADILKVVGYFDRARQALVSGDMRPDHPLNIDISAPLGERMASHLRTVDIGRDEAAEKRVDVPVRLPSGKTVVLPRAKTVYLARGRDDERAFITYNRRVSGLEP